MPDAQKLETKDEVAHALAVKVFKNNDPHFPIARFLDTPRERAFMMHLLNGPGAEWVMDVSEFRWVSVHPSDFANLTTLEEFAAFCKTHLV